MPHLKTPGVSSAALMMLLLTSCVGLKPQPIEVNTLSTELRPNHLILAKQVLPKPIHFKVITPQVAMRDLERYSTEGQEPFVYYALDEASYLNLSVWLLDVLEHIKALDSEISRLTDKKS